MSLRERLPCVMSVLDAGTLQSGRPPYGSCCAMIKKFEVVNRVEAGLT